MTGYRGLVPMIELVYLDEREKDELLDCIRIMQNLTLLSAPWMGHWSAVDRELSVFYSRARKLTAINRDRLEWTNTRRAFLGRESLRNIP